jgi:hypothetical protein
MDRGYINPIPILLPYPSRGFTIGEPKFMTDPPELHFVEEGLAITTEPVLYRNRRGFMRYVPAGLPHDGMSIPGWIEWAGIWDRWCPADRQAVVLHDFTYAAYDAVRSWPVTRREADRDLLDGFRLNPKSRGDRLRYLAVRMGGYGIWRRKSACALQRGWFEALEMGPMMLERWVEAQKKRGRSLED